MTDGLLRDTHCSGCNIQVTTLEAADGLLPLLCTVIVILTHTLALGHVTQQHTYPVVGHNQQRMRHRLGSKFMAQVYGTSELSSTLSRRGRRHRSDLLPNSSRSMGKDDTKSSVNHP